MQGFLRAFSDNPNAFASGFNRIEKVMKALRVRRLLLFPRFHQTVKDSLEGNNAPEVRCSRGPYQRQPPWLHTVITTLHPAGIDPSAALASGCRILPGCWQAVCAGFLMNECRE